MTADYQEPKTIDATKGLIIIICITFMPVFSHYL